MTLRLAPFGIWVAHASLSYALVAVHCHLHELHETALGATATRVLLFATTLAALTAAGAVALVSYRAWRRRSELDPNGRRGFDAGFTGLANGLVLLYLLWALVLDAVIDLC